MDAVSGRLILNQNDDIVLQEKEKEELEEEEESEHLINSNLLYYNDEW